MIKVTKWGTTVDGFQTVNLPEYILIPETLWDPDPIDYEEKVKQYIENTYKTPVEDFLIYGYYSGGDQFPDFTGLLVVRDIKKLFKRSAVMLQDRLNTISDEKVEFVIEYLANLFETENTIIEGLLESADHIIDYDERYHLKKINSMLDEEKEYEEIHEEIQTNL